MGWFRGRRARGVAVELLGAEELHQRVVAQHQDLQVLGGVAEGEHRK
jgi:hypothetical protein